MRGRHVPAPHRPAVRPIMLCRKESVVIHTSLYALYAGAATSAATTGDTVTHTAGGALAAFVVGRLAWDRRHRVARAGRAARTTVTPETAVLPEIAVLPEPAQVPAA